MSLSQALWVIGRSLAAVIAVLIVSCAPATQPDTENAQSDVASSQDEALAATEDDTNTSTPDTSVPVESDEGTLPALTTGDVRIFMAINGAQDSDSLRTVDSSGRIHDIQLETSVKALVAYAPSSDDLIVFDTYTSPSYSKNTKRPQTSDDRLIVAQKWHGGGSMDFQEYDPSTLTTSSQGVASYRSSHDVEEQNLTFDAEGAFYRTNVEEDLFRRTTTGGDLVYLRHDDNVESVVLGRLQNYALIHAYGDELFGITPVWAGNPTVAFYSINTDTASQSELGSFSFPGFDSYNSWTRPVVDNGIATWASAETFGSQTTVRLWSMSLADAPHDPVTIDLEIDGEFQVLDVDRDDDFFVMLIRRPGTGIANELALFDKLSGDLTVVDTGLKIFDVEVVRYGEPAA